MKDVKMTWEEFGALIEHNEWAKSQLFHVLSSKISVEEIRKKSLSVCLPIIVRNNPMV